jgi:hypothetical protein
VTRLFSRRGGRRQSSPDRDTIGPPRDIPLVQVTHTDSSFASRCAKSCHLSTTEFHHCWPQCCSHASQLAPSNMGVVCGLGKRVRQSIGCVRLGMRLGVNIPPTVAWSDKGIAPVVAYSAVQCLVHFESCLCSISRSAKMCAHHGHCTEAIHGLARAPLRRSCGRACV